MSSDKQRNANRENAKKSTGPRTPEGKARSSMNAVKHGLTAKKLAMTEEEILEHDRLIDRYVDHFQPQDPIEEDLIEELAMAKLRQKRAWRKEADLLRIEHLREEDAFKSDFPEATDWEKLALCTEWLANNGKALDHIRRYEGQMHRMYHRCLDKLERKQRERQPAENASRQNEPNWSAQRPKITILPAPIDVKRQRTGEDEPSPGSGGPKDS